MKISVITAVYNRASTIARTIDSVASQSYSDVEHIIINGSSSDGTLDVIEQNRNPRMVVHSEPDKGIYDALNKGIERATGDVIGVLHSDDLFAGPGVLTKVAQLFDDQSLDAVYADAAFFNPGKLGKLVRRYDSSRFAPEKIARGWMPAHTTLFLRRGVFERFGLYRIDYKIAADFEFVARTFGSGALKAVYVPEVWVQMQMGGVSTGGLQSKILMNREVMRACRENNIRTSYAKILSKYPMKLFDYLKR
jgi:glycosyltransferase involved in cell wall biosynthesis